MSVESYTKRIYDTEQKHMDLESFRDLVGFIHKRPVRPEDAQMLRIKEVRVPNVQSTPIGVQLLTPAGVPATRTRGTKGRGTKSRAQEIHSMDNHLRHSCWSPALS